MPLASRLPAASADCRELDESGGQGAAAADDFTEMWFCLRASCVRPAPPTLVTPDQLFSSVQESFTKRPVVLRVLLNLQANRWMNKKYIISFNLKSKILHNASVNFYIYICLEFDQI